MQSDASRVPSVACLLYLAADQVVPQAMSARMLKATKVPCRPVWVHPIRLSATIAAATFLSLRDAGSLTVHLENVTSKDPTYKMPPGRLRTHTMLTVTEMDSTPQGGLAGALVAIARGLPDGLLGEFQPEAGWSISLGSTTGHSPTPSSGTWSGPSFSTRVTTRGPRGSASSRTVNGSPPSTRPGPPRCAGGSNSKPRRAACALRCLPSVSARPFPSQAVVGNQMLR